MENKQFVKTRFPGAKAHNVAGGYEIWANTGLMETMIGEGKTKDEAWTDAKKWIEDLPVETKAF